MTDAPDDARLPATLPDGSPLPEVRRGHLSWDETMAMALAVAVADPGVEVFVKRAAEVDADAPETTPRRAVQLLRAGLLHAVQLRYRYEGECCVDTLRRDGDAVEVLRFVTA
ncbi:MAG: hypothetical protein RIT45_3934 [Pseudomonadota bacterium]|jgi:hypothetical protein